MTQVSIGKRSRSPLPPLVLPHEVERGLDQAAEPLGGGEGGFGYRMTTRKLAIRWPRVAPR
jgi:hypothetical protein